MPTMPKSAKALAREIEGVWEAAERENRGLTADERQYVSGLVDDCKAQKELEAKIAEIGGGMLPFAQATDPRANWAGGGGPGDVFVASKGYQDIRDADHRPPRYSSGPIEVSRTPLLTKGTLLEAGAGGPGGGLVPPSYDPGVVSKLFEPLGVADVFGSSVTTGSQIRYVVEGTATNAAAGVAEAGTKPESTIALSRSWSRSRRSPRSCRSATSCSRTHPASRAT
jgi:hypothetical protein